MVKQVSLYKRDAVPHYSHVDNADATVVDTTDQREETLGEFLATRARRASESLLVGHAITAVLAAVAIAAWRGPLWDVRMSVAMCFLAFGVWGIADRDLQHHPTGSRSLLLGIRTARVVAAALGFAAVAYLMLALMGRALGTIIS